MSTLVYLIDDDSEEAEILKEAFDQIGMAVNLQLFSKGTEALQALRNRKPDYIFLDLNLPVISGYEILRTIRKTTGFENVRVIIYSTSISDKTIQETKDLNVFEYLLKPYDMQVFCQKLRQVLA